MPDDYLQHPSPTPVNFSSIPLCGRRKHLADMLQFWSQNSEKSGPGFILLQGEQGQGKSALIAEFKREILADRGVYAEILPNAVDGKNLLRDTITRLWNLEAVKQMALMPPEPEADQLAISIKELSKIRPFVFLMDGINLSDAGLRTMVTDLVSKLTGINCTILVSSNQHTQIPHSWSQGKSTLDIELDGLEVVDIHQLMISAFGNEHNTQYAEIIHLQSAGNPQIVMDILRGVENAGHLVARKPGVFRISLQPAVFETFVKNFLQTLVEIKLHDSDEQVISSLRKIAGLGFVFDRQAAEFLLDSEALLPSLKNSKLIVAVYNPVKPMNADISLEQPFSFSNLWFQRALADKIQLDPAEVVKLLSTSPTIYSIDIWKFLADNCQHLCLDPESLAELTEAGIQTANWLEIRSQISEGILLIDTLQELLFKSCGLQKTSTEIPEEISDMYFRSVSRKLFLLKRQASTDSYRQMAEHGLNYFVTRHGTRYAEMTLAFLVHLNRNIHRNPEISTQNLNSQVDDLVQKFPVLCGTAIWLIYLGDTALVAAGRMKTDELSRVDVYFQAVLQNSACDEKFRLACIKRVGVSLLNFFETQAELDKKWKLLEELNECCRPDDPVMTAATIMFYLRVGNIADLLSHWEYSAKIWLDRNFRTNLYVCSVDYLIALAHCGENFDRLLSIRLTYLKYHRRPITPLEDYVQLTGLFINAILLNEAEWVSARLAELDEIHDMLYWVEFLLQFESLENANNDLAGIIETATNLPPSFIPIIRDLLESVKSINLKNEAEAVVYLKRILENPVIHLHQLPIIRAAGQLIKSSLDNKEISDLFVVRLNDALDWCYNRNLEPALKSLLNTFKNLLPAVDYKRWTRLQQTLDPREFYDSLKPLHAKIEEDKIQVRLFGEALSVKLPGEKTWTRPRGTRLKILIGLLAADQILRKPLEKFEFIRIAADQTSTRESKISNDRSRNILSIAVHRLRDMLGIDAVLTGCDTPRLNLENVDVDLIRANTALRRCERGLSESNLIIAYAGMRKYLSITRAELPYSDMFNNFFDALREDFSSRFRKCLLDLVTQLKINGDTLRASELLDLALPVMLDDEELVALHRSILEVLNLRVDAERLRLKHDDARQE
jgi:hypothetical protein